MCHIQIIIEGKKTLHVNVFFLSQVTKTIMIVHLFGGVVGNTHQELTVEKVFCKCLIGHIFSYKQPLFTFVTAAKQICQSMVSKLTNSPCFFLKQQIMFSLNLIVDNKYR